MVFNLKLRKYKWYKSDICFSNERKKRKEKSCETKWASMGRNQLEKTSFKKLHNDLLLDSSKEVCYKREWLTIIFSICFCGPQVFPFSRPRHALLGPTPFSLSTVFPKPLIFLFTSPPPPTRFYVRSVTNKVSIAKH